MRADTFSGAVLAGGRGRRFGRTKADLPWGEGTLLEQAVAVLCRLFPEVLVVGGEVAGARAVPDLDPAQGPLGGLYAALAAARNPYLFVAACDLPFLNPALIRGLCGAAEGFQVVVPETEPGYLEPLHAVYHRSCLPLIEEQLRAGELRVAHFFPRAQVRLVNASALEEMGRRPEDFFNINTPGDYCRALALRVPVVAVAGPSGRGKTTLLEWLLAELTARGYRVAAVKHTRHPGAGADAPGKDTWRLRQAGAVAVGLAGPAEAVLRLPPMPPRQLAAGLAAFTPLDLVLAEGFKAEDVPKILVTGVEPLSRMPGEILAVYGRAQPPPGVPRFEPGQEHLLVDLLVRRYLP